jgi:outer membrane biosynthesis protein TonB
MKAFLLTFLTMAAVGSGCLLEAQVAAGRTPARQKAARPLTSTELLLKLYHGTPAAAVAAVKVRGIDFDINPQLEKLLVEAGAERSLLALAALRRVEQTPQPAAAGPAAAIRVDAAAQARKLVQRRDPVLLPADAARAAGGKVTLEVQVGVDGRVKNVRVTGGNGPLSAAAAEAVRGYVYRPTVLDGEPVEVTTEVTIEFAGRN